MPGWTPVLQIATNEMSAGQPLIIADLSLYPVTQPLMADYFRAEKKPALTGFFQSGKIIWNASVQCLDMLIQTTFVTGGLIAVDQAPGGITIHQRNSGLVSGLSSLLVAGLDSIDNFLHSGAHHRTGAGILQAALFRLTSTFFRGLDIGQDGTPDAGMLKKSAIMSTPLVQVNPCHKGKAWR